MDIQILPKQMDIPEFDSNEIKVRHIEYFDTPYQKYEEEEITEEIITNILKEIPDGINIYLFLDPDGETDWLEVNCDGEWISLCFIGDSDESEYCSYNPDYANTADQIIKFDFSDSNIYTNLESGGQSPIPKMEAIQDIDAGIKAVEYFIRTGKLYPGIDWARPR